MGIEIDRSEFTAADHESFCRRLEENLAALESALARPGFGVGPGSLGAELEMYIVDSEGNPLHANQEILAAADDPLLTLELNRYNLEYNLAPCALANSPFESTEQQILDRLNHVRGVAATHGGRIVPIGILPTLRASDFGPQCVTERQRYHALVAQLIKRRGGEFRIDINGEEPLQMEMADITLEGANTSFQVHYRVDPSVFADTFNAIQMMTPLALAIGANSPTLFGHSLWHETRIPLFKQSIDTRVPDRYSWHEPARVSFGQGWARRGAAELFREVVRIYPPLLPVIDPDEQPVGDGPPMLSELRLHQSTVWLWNRPIYDHTDGGHLRVEMRSLPAGPTAVDMVANAAFLIGLAEGIRPHIAEVLPAIPFGIAEYNFYRAAQYGLNARLVWPLPQRFGHSERPVYDIIADSMQLAADGLSSIGIDAEEAGRYLAVIEKRLDRRQTGAIWQRRKLAMLSERGNDEKALHRMLEEFIGNSEDNQPVAEWRL